MDKDKIKKLFEQITVAFLNEACVDYNPEAGEWYKNYSLEDEAIKRIVKWEKRLDKLLKE